ncbi:uncharacterized protein MELLADRAFT_111810 [Melampsora larici-populina 98AG31]|uniref:Secreted protein n=1 Tax=Melampsora larici-populina (strain 98AG31 / pathotype 3-4-7) TaxID=747676 RepID=F4S4F3_MELLP|nr:uncharacterized protein MELLADRAFT_111810 [Melampsora larici-populina 98AG31]EGG00478.1 hypothetical protein MELLADRAFT_111810 [Melampsora larici-populina 98AG31]
MTLATGIVLTSCSFLLGAQFIHWSVDHRTLWTNPISPIPITNSLIYYTNLSNLILQSSSSTTSSNQNYILMVFKFITLIGLISLLSKLKNSSISVVFDLASLVLLITSIIVEIAHVIPLLKTLPKSPISFNPSDPLTITQTPTSLRPTSSIIMTIQSIASLNTIISVTLTGLIVLQIAQMCIEKSLDKTLGVGIQEEKKLVKVVKVKGLDKQKVLRIKEQLNGNLLDRQNPLEIQSQP